MSVNMRQTSNRMTVPSPLTRALHAINAVAVLGLIPTGWAIYNAAPLYAFEFPKWAALHLYLTPAIRWHFLFAWLLTLNSIVFISLRVVARRGGPSLFPVSMVGLVATAEAALTLKLSHSLTSYNEIQRAAYLSAFALLVSALLTGLALWKPVQFQTLAGLLGGYEVARHVHFWTMVGMGGFVVVHLAMTLLVPRTLLGILFGWSRP